METKPPYVGLKKEIEHTEGWDKKIPTGYSYWVEEGHLYIAPTISPNKFGPHDYSYLPNYIPFNGTGECKCGCVMGGFSSQGDVDPFGACPLAPLEEPKTYEEIENELAEIKGKIYRGDINIMVKGGDMADNGWTLISWANAEKAGLEKELREAVAEIKRLKSAETTWVSE